MTLLLMPALAALTAFGAPPNTQPDIPGVDRFQRDCELAGQRLWGTSLCAPVVVVHASSGSFRTSRKPPPAPLPALRGNTAFKWGSENWIMLLDPLPSDPEQRAALLFHEAWHVRQAELGLPSNTVVAGHLEDPIKRFLLRMEWAALKHALQTRGLTRTRHIAQALNFRQRRTGSDPGAAASERDHMRHEGLAAYTGTKLSEAPVKLALAEIEAGPSKASLSRSFGYVSGPAWGLLLDEVAPGWKELLKTGADLPDLVPIKAAAVSRADDYEGSSVLAEEVLAGVKRQAALRDAIHATAPHRSLRLPLAKMNISFDPNSVSAAPDGSPIYRTITVSDLWGQVEVRGSILRISPDYKDAFLPWPLRSSDTVQLAPGWRVQEQTTGGALLIGPSS
jgi:hypothetical protein